MSKSAVYARGKTTHDVRKTSERGLSAKTLKWIAMITMIFDHAAIAVVFPMYILGYFADVPLLKLYEGMRLIGRLSFPLFIYLIVDSFFYTGNRKRFAAGLLVFALISEIPFDAAIPLPIGPQYGMIRDVFLYQNIYFTLFIGTLCLMASEYVFHGAAAFVSEKEVQDRRKQKRSDVPERAPGFNLLLVACITVIGCGLAYFLHVDYGVCGVLAMVLAYLIRRTGRRKLVIFGIILPLALDNIFALFGVLDGLVIFASNGSRGNIRHKWLYYLFYPAHLAVLGVIKLSICHLWGMF